MLLFGLPAAWKADMFIAHNADHRPFVLDRHTEHRHDPRWTQIALSKFLCSWVCHGLVSCNHAFRQHRTEIVWVLGGSELNSLAVLARGPVKQIRAPHGRPILG